MSDPHPFAFQSWAEVYQALRAKAEASRGTVTVAPQGAPGASWPHTSSRDAFAVSLVFDAAIDEHASGAMVARWIVESDLLAGEPDDGTDPYVGNRSLWETLASAVVELDHAHAPLPAPSLIDDAMRELETVHPAAPSERRNASGTMLVTVFSEPTWRAMALRQLAFFVTLRGAIHRGKSNELPLPVTTNGDVVALAVYWSDQLAHLGSSASDTQHRLVYSCWREVVHRVLRDVKTAPGREPCAHNQEFWTSLLLLTTQSDACNAEPSPWVFHAPASHRNAAPVDTGPTLVFPPAKADDAARMQRDEYARLRGEDVVTGRLITRVPRTTVHDVRQLAERWTELLTKVGLHSFADVSYRHVIDRWYKAVAQVAAVPQDVDANSVYAYNADFWEAVITVSIQIATTAEAPSRWELAKQTVQKVAQELPQRVKNLWDDLLSHPLLSFGIGAGSAVFLYLLTRPRRSHSEPQS